VLLALSSVFARCYGVCQHNLFLIFPKEILEMLRRIFVFEVELGTLKAYGDWFMLVLWLPVSILIDYVSLFKTRVILGDFGRSHAAPSGTAASSNSYCWHRLHCVQVHSFYRYFGYGAD
jgi:hypothetical protein